MRELRLSASAIQDFKACPMRYLYGYVYGLQRDKEKDSLRIGSNWHRCHEILGMTPQGRCPDCLRNEELDADCPLCEGKGVLPTDLADAVVRSLNQAYKVVPEEKTYDEWETERVILLYSLSGYRWCYAQENPFEVVASEVWFDIPVINPETHKQIPKTRLVGRIDHIVKHKETGLLYVFERKSTSQSIFSSRYWGSLSRGLQTRIYLYAARMLQLLGRLKDYGISADDPLVAGIHYDVWHKPDIRPKKITKKDLKELQESGTYYGEEFDVPENEFETPAMYGARLLADISVRPEFYFARREVSCIDSDLEDLERSLVKQSKLIQYTEQHDLWDDNQSVCEQPYYCDYRDICFPGLIVGPQDCPEGYTKRGEEKNGRV